MINCVQKQLAKYKQPPPKIPQNYLFQPNPVYCGKQLDTILHKEPSSFMDKDEKIYIQQVVGSFLYYARAIDMTILLALSNIESKRADPTEKLRRECAPIIRLHGYAPRYKNTTSGIRYHT